MIKILKGFFKLLFHWLNLVVVVSIAVAYSLFYCTELHSYSIVLDVARLLENVGIDLLITQITSSFIVVSITAMLTTKGKTIFWEDTIHYMLINPPMMNLRAITDYCFFDVMVSFIAFILGKNGAVLLAFIFNIFFLCIMTYKLLKIYFGKEEIKKELLSAFYKKVEDYKTILDKEYGGWEHYESIQSNEPLIPLYEKKEKSVHELHKIYFGEEEKPGIDFYVEKTKECTLNSILEGKIDEVAENLSFLVDFRGYGMIREFLLRNDEHKEDYLTAFFELRIKKIQSLIRYCENEKTRDGFIVKPDEWLRKYIYETKEDFENSLEKREQNDWWLYGRVFSDFYGYDENEKNSDFDIIIDFLNPEHYGIKMRRCLFELIILDEIFSCRYINFCAQLCATRGEKCYGECTVNIIGELVERDNVLAINDILDMVYFNQEVIGRGFACYLNRHEEKLGYLKNHSEQFNTTVNITVKMIEEKIKDIKCDYSCCEEHRQ